MAATPPSRTDREPAYRPVLADLAGMAAFGVATFVFVWWLRLWLGWLIWLGAAVGMTP